METRDNGETPDKPSRQQTASKEDFQPYYDHHKEEDKQRSSNAPDPPTVPPRPGQLTQPGTTPVEPEPPGQLTVPKEIPAEPQPPGQLTRPGVDKAGPTPDKMKKGVYLSALIYVEGFQEPAADFNSLSISLLKKNLNACFAIPHDGVSMALKEVNVQNDVEQDDGEDSVGQSGGVINRKSPARERKKKEEKFQF